MEPKMTDREKYDLSRKAGTQPCGVCGWKDGDGVATCFYSEQLGVVTHQNSDAAVEATMTPEQASLYKLRMKLLFPDEEARQAHLAKSLAEKKAQYEKHLVEKQPYPFLVDSEGTEITVEEQHARYRQKLEAEPLGNQEPYSSWIKRGGSVFYYEPHPGCGGIAIGVGPYHIRCSKCSTEVKLWEHGVDYDIG